MGPIEKLIQTIRDRANLTDVKITNSARKVYMGDGMTDYDGKYEQAQQRKIAAEDKRKKVIELSTKLNDAIQSLKKAEQSIYKYKQAVVDLEAELDKLLK